MCLGILPAHMLTTCVLGDHGGQQGASDHLELDLKTMSCRVSARIGVRATSALDSWAIFLDLIYGFSYV